MSVRPWLPLLSLGLGLLSPAAVHAEKTEASDDAQSEEPPKLVMTVEERGPRLPWIVGIENHGVAPAKVIADPRLLSFDVKVPGKKKTERCKLPADLFPKRADRRMTVVLGPGEGVKQPFDPRLYCFAAGGQWRLVPGALVSPHFGWDEKKKVHWKNGKRIETLAAQKPPYVGSGVDDDEDEDEGVKALHAEPFALRSEYAKWAKTRLEEDRERKDKPAIEMRMAQGSDAQAERTATVSIKLTNRSKHRERLYFRRELVSFEVMGPDGLSTCDAQPDLRAPDPQEFLSLGAKRSITVTSRLVELCPTGTFSRPGLYLVHARLDATEDGSEFDIDAFTGRVATEQPATVRIRSGELPFLKKRPIRERVRVSAKPR